MKPAPGAPAPWRSSGRSEYPAAGAAKLPGGSAGALDYLFVASKEFAQRYFPNGVTRSALLKAPVVAFDHLDDMHQAFLQQNFDLPPGSVPCHIVNSSEAFVQLARRGTTCCMIPHLQIEKELNSGELIDLTPACSSAACSTGTASPRKAA